MKKANFRKLLPSVIMLGAFIIWTAAIQLIDVRPIGPGETEVGFAALNQLIHNLTGTNMLLYSITDWAGLIPLFTACAFGFTGLVQWISRKSLAKVDYSIFVLGGFYIIVFAVYILFEICVVNYRPILINGISEASYPSSTTMLVLCIMPTTVMQLNSRLRNKKLRKAAALIITAFTVFMVIARLISGVHWITDIAGGILLSAGLVLMYRFFISLKAE